MTELLILGDSFVEDKDVKWHRGSMITFQKMLEDSGLFSKITNLGQSSSNFWHSYQIFKKNYNKGMFVIWGVTAPGRISTEFGHVANYDNAELKYYISVKQQNDAQAEFYKSAMRYFRYISNNEYDKYVQDLIIERILEKELLDNFLLIPAFPNSLPDSIFNRSGTNSLSDLFRLENTRLVKTQSDWHKFSMNYIDERPNHITEPNHKILGEKIIESIISKKPVLEFKTSEFVVPSKEELSKYIIKR